MVDRGESSRARPEPAVHPGIRRPFGFRYARRQAHRTVGRMDENKRTTYRTSEVARELGISAEWLRNGEERGFFPPARRDPDTGHRYYTREDIERLRIRRVRAGATGA